MSASSRIRAVAALVVACVPQEGGAQVLTWETRYSETNEDLGLTCLNNPEVGNTAAVCDDEQNAVLSEIFSAPDAADAGCPAMMATMNAGHAASPEATQDEICGCIRATNRTRGGILDMRCRPHADWPITWVQFAEQCVPDAPCTMWLPTSVEGMITENFYDSQHGQEYSQTCEALLGSGQYSCEEDFVVAPGNSLGGFCNQACHFCRSMADETSSGASTCLQSLLLTEQEVRNQCATCTADGCEWTCGEVEFTPPCSCVDDSVFGNTDCPTLLAEGVLCDRDLGAVQAFLAGTLVRDMCPLSCHVCTCDPPITISCQDQIDDVLGGQVLDGCFGQEAAVARRGWNQLFSCARSASATCGTTDCFNLYFDVREACLDTPDLTQRCAFPGPSAGRSIECTLALLRMHQHGQDCVGPEQEGIISGSTMDGHLMGEGTLEEPLNLNVQVYNEIDAKCEGCDMQPIIDGCGGEWMTKANTDEWECNEVCANAVERFWGMGDAWITQCGALWGRDGATMEMVQRVTNLYRLHSKCTAPCEVGGTDLHDPPFGTLGDCLTSGSMAHRATCTMTCLESYQVVGTLEVICVAGNLKERLTDAPWSAESAKCECAPGQFSSQEGQDMEYRCQECTDCPPGYISDPPCSGYSESTCVECPTGTYENAISGTCEVNPGCVRASNPLVMPGDSTHPALCAMPCGGMSGMIHSCVCEIKTRPPQTQAVSTNSHVRRVEGASAGTCDGLVQHSETCSLSCGDRNPNVRSSPAIHARRETTAAEPPASQVVRAFIDACALVLASGGAGRHRAAVLRGALVCRLKQSKLSRGWQLLDPRRSGVRALPGPKHQGDVHRLGALLWPPKPPRAQRSR